MSFTVTIKNSGQSFPIQSGQSVLDAALEANIVLPYSCKNGACRSCLGRVLEGEYEPGEGTLQLLDPEEKEEGFTLFCETRACSDLLIESKEIQVLEDIIVKKLPARVIAMEQKAPYVKILKLQLPANATFKFKAGQYIDFLLRGNKRRSYSIANAPAADNTVDLHVRHLPGGLFTDHVFGSGNTAMQVCEILRIEGPLGSFFLRRDTEKPIILAATGTGFAPIKAIMEDVIRDGLQRPIRLYWGARRPDGLYMNELAQQWAAELPFFEYIPVCSRPQPEDAWSGRIGWVQEQIQQDLQDLSQYEVYACGNPGMTLDTQKLCCGSLGLPPDSFFADAFTSEADKPQNKPAPREC